MSVLVRETVTLHKVLSRHLSVAVVEVRDLARAIYARNLCVLTDWLYIALSVLLGCYDAGVRGD
jgi:hypothetical protein